MSTSASKPSPSNPPQRVTGVQLMQGIGVQPAKAFWADAWSQVLRRKGAVVGLVWISIMAALAVVSPLIANGHPLIMRTIDTRDAAQASRAFAGHFGAAAQPSAREVVSTLRRELELHAPTLEVSRFFVPGANPVSSEELVRIADQLSQAKELDAKGQVVSVSSPLLRSLTSVDVMMLPLGLVAVPWIFLGGRRRAVAVNQSTGGRAYRLLRVVYGGLVAIAVIAAASVVQKALGRSTSPGWVLPLKRVEHPEWIVAGLAGLLFGTLFMLPPIIQRLRHRMVVVGIASLVAILTVGFTWDRPLDTFDYQDRAARGEIEASYTLIPWSPSQRFPELNRVEPLSTIGEGLKLPPGTPGGDRVFLLGTDAFGQDVVSNLLHACRLSISIGLVSTSISVLIGVTIGALMGYFGGIIDLVLFRIVEIFMAVPVLFLLIVTASVLSDEWRSTYVMMAIIGCFTWTGAARFTRAEFMKLRRQDFVQSAEAVGLPLRSILFKHMLPNGITPVLVDASFAIAAAINIEAVLSFLNLGPIDQPSWGKLLSSATSAEGVFVWWLAVFPGLAIFFSVLSYNMIGEALRDAIDPKLKKARV